MILRSSGRTREADTIFASLGKSEKLPGNQFTSLASSVPVDQPGGRLVRPALEIALNLVPDDPASLNNVAYALADREIDVQEATKLIEKAMASETSQYDPDAIDSLVWAHLKPWRATDALREQEKAMGLFQSRGRYLGTAYYHLGAILAKLGDRGKALRMLSPEFAVGLSDRRQLAGIRKVAGGGNRRFGWQGRTGFPTPQSEDSKIASST